MTAERPRRARTRAPLAALAVFALAAVLAGAWPVAVRGQQVRPWVPPSADSLQRWASEAKVLFQENRGDSVGGSNFHAYDRVGTMGRRLVRSLGRSGLRQAPAVETILDSLGLDVDVTIDPRFPEFVLLMVRNPYKLTARAIGFLYWYQGADLRMQGAMFWGGLRPLMRVWWTGYSDQPYSLGIIDHERATDGRTRMTLFRMNQGGLAWGLRQTPDQGPDLSGAGDAIWADINADDRPELVAWVRAPNDTLFESCLSCPSIIHEHTYTEGRGGFALHDLRLLPSPYSTFTLFIRQLADGNRTAAARLLKDPSKVDEAIAAGWGLRSRAKAWNLEYAEDERWPRWLAFRHHGPRGDQRYIVHFELREGRWIIREWLRPRPAAARTAPADSATTTVKKPPAGAAPSRSKP